MIFARQDVQPQTHVAFIATLEQLNQRYLNALFVDGQFRSIERAAAEVRQQADAIVPIQQDATTVHAMTTSRVRPAVRVVGGSRRRDHQQHEAARADRDGNGEPLDGCLGHGSQTGRHAWYAALNDVRDEPSLSVRSVTRARDDECEHDRGTRAAEEPATMIAPITASTPTALAVEPVAQPEAMEQETGERRAGTGCRCRRRSP